MLRPPERRLRQDLVTFAHLTHARGLLVAFDGNLSTRLSDGLILCTRAGCHKGLLTEDDLVVIDLAGRKIRGAGEPTSEMAMHLACYRARPDVEAVVHAHPPMCIAFTVAGLTLARCVLPEVVLTIGAVPTLPYATTGTRTLAELVGEAAKGHDAVVLDRHGTVTLGTSLLEAFAKLETIEHFARIMKAARDLGRVQDLPADESVRLRTMGLRRYGGPPRSLAALDGPNSSGASGADLPPACLACSGCGDPRPGGLGKPAGFAVARVG